MATPGFGFSVGDFIAGISLVKKLIRALNDAAGSRAAYRKLIFELLSLEEALTDISKLRLGQAQESQRLALKRVATQCQNSIETFLSKNAKFNISLSTQPSTTPPTWRTNFHKIQWALCKDAAVDDLRTEIAAHTATLNVTLATIQVSITKLQEESLDNCTQLLRAVYDDTKEASARIEQNQQTLAVHTGMIQKVSRAATSILSGQQKDGLLPLVRKGLQWHIRIFDAVTQMQQLLCSIPPQIEREQPVLFEDAHARLTPFHVEFINSYSAFQAVLEARFENMPGLRKVRNLEYAIQDTQSKRILDLSGRWESIIRPGRKVVMSIVFQLPEAVISSCPGCSTETYNPLVNEGSDVQCENPDCRILYRCVTDAHDSTLGKRKRPEPCSSPTKRMKHEHKENGTDEDDQDGIQRLPPPADTISRCIKDIYHNVYDNGESDITEQFHACRPGHICSDPIVHEYDRKISSRGSEPINPRDLRCPDDISGAENRSMSVSAGRLDLGNAVHSPPSESDEYCPGWTPECEFDWDVPVHDGSISSISRLSDDLSVAISTPSN